ncbi:MULTISPECIES: xanthine dehydrogenase family protein molybdopterin-binding subunit [unclassified Streptomyces]|uniref:xanthine dehydrogenase family protein molybdopterin-binding subunit n=1 Tax=unclassified Streptomyces TaxID=2593676 RepID=UPI002E17E8AE|nr:MULTISPECIES: xanthine dehydrogenase family protein molybdopterin-binding subunit [unclassified Streptomyces]
MTTTTTTAAGTTKSDSVGVGRSRIEGREKVTGAARYAGEFPFTDLAHGWLVLSTVARGRVRSVGDEAVRSMPGVLAVMHHGNAPRINTDYLTLMGPPDGILHVFQDDKVKHAGWPVALVVAETSEQAREAAEALVVEYDTEPHDIAFEADRPGTYAPEGSEATKGDLEAELAASAAVVDERYTTPETHHTAMEPHAVTVRWEDGRLEVYDANQGSKAVADQLAQTFSLDPSAVRVRSEHVGGAFGGKLVAAHHIAAVMAATELHRPVRLTMTRRQVFAITGYRSPTTQRMRLGADADGRLRAFGHDAQSLTSNIREFVEASAGYGRVMYASDAHHSVNRVVPLDLPTPTFVRAPGEAPGSYAVESALDELAEKLGMDPVALRVRNEPDVGPVSGLPFSSRNLLGCYEDGARRFGWEGRDPRPRVRREGRWLLGTGVAACSFPSGVAPSTASVTAEHDGTFTVRITAADVGTGARTALTQIAADELGVDQGLVRVRIADSDFGQAWLSGGSMGTRSWGWAVMAASRELRDRLSPTAPIPTEGLTVRTDTTELVGALAQKERYSYGAQFAEVAVDVASGEVRVRRLLGVFSAGRIINPLTARSQLVGGMTWGISMALHEEAVRDAADGGHVGADFAGYHVAANADVPVVEAHWVDDSDPDDPVGIKGVGEIGIVGTAAAIGNAVWHATGVRHRDLPLRPDRVLLAEAERNA